MYELGILAILIIIFVGLSYYFTMYDFSTYRAYDDETLAYHYSNTDVAIMVAVVLSITIVVICIIFNEKVISYLKSGSKLSSLGYGLAKVKSWFVSPPAPVRGGRSFDDVPKIMSGGGRKPIPHIATDYMADDEDMPYSSDDEDY